MRKLTLLFCAFSISALSQVTLKKVKPSSTDPLITTFDVDSHYVYLNQSSISKEKLVVHLPGTFGEPKRARLFGSLAANLGFHSIGLMYPNVPTVGSFCTNNADLSCFENVRREIIEGVDYSEEIDIQFPEGIQNRLTKLLVYLSENFPNENWQQFLNNNGNVKWEKIIFSGHSQGGGHAAVIAKFFPIYRALCFSSPKDWNNTIDNVPPWVTSVNWQTDRRNIFVFNHTLDEHEQQIQIWNALGLSAFGALVNVDTNPFPYTYSRQLETSYNVISGDEHASTIQDNKTPKINNVPVFEPVWTYMLTIEDVSSLDEVETKGNLFFYDPIHQKMMSFDNRSFSEIQLFNLNGSLVSFSKESNVLDVSDVSPGLYLIVCDNGIQQKFVKF